MRKLLLSTAAFLAAAGVAVWYWWHPIERWFAYATGSYNCTPKLCPNGVIHNYNFNSGWGSIILPVLLTPMITLGGIGAMFWWHHQCHVDGCLRYAGPPRRPTAAGDLACWKHHPESHIKMTLERLHLRHKGAS